MTQPLPSPETEPIAAEAGAELVQPEIQKKMEDMTPEELQAEIDKLKAETEATTTLQKIESGVDTGLFQSPEEDGDLKTIELPSSELSSDSNEQTEDAEKIIEAANSELSAKEQGEAVARHEITDIFEQKDKQEINKILDDNIDNDNFKQRISPNEVANVNKETINSSLKEYIGSGDGKSEDEKLKIFKNYLDYCSKPSEIKDDSEHNWHNTESYSLLNALDKGPAQEQGKQTRLELMSEAEHPFECRVALKDASEEKGLSPDESHMQAEDLKDDAITGQDMQEVRVPNSETEKVQAWFNKRGLSEVKVVPIEFFEIKKIIQRNVA